MAVKTYNADTFEAGNPLEELNIKDVIYKEN